MTDNCSTFPSNRGIDNVQESNIQPYNSTAASLRRHRSAPSAPVVPELSSSLCQLAYYTSAQHIQQLMVSYDPSYGYQENM